MAEVEETHLRRPDAGKLKQAAARLAAGIDHVQAAVESAGYMSGRLTRFSAELAASTRPRLEAAMEGDAALARAMEGMRSKLADGSYPAMDDCINLIGVLDEVMARFRVNASMHRAEGL